MTAAPRAREAARLSSFYLRRIYRRLPLATRERMVRLHQSLGREPSVSEVIADVREQEGKR